MLGAEASDLVNGTLRAGGPYSKLILGEKVSRTVAPTNRCQLHRATTKFVVAHLRIPEFADHNAGFAVVVLRA